MKTRLISTHPHPDTVGGRDIALRCPRPARVGRTVGRLVSSGSFARRPVDAGGAARRPYRDSVAGN